MVYLFVVVMVVLLVFVLVKECFDLENVIKFNGDVFFYLKYVDLGVEIGYVKMYFEILCDFYIFVLCGVME